MILRAFPVVLVLAATPAFAEQSRSVPDTPASFTLSGNARWVVLTETADGEAAIGLARTEIGENPKVQVARTREGKYAVLIGPQTEMPAAELKEKFPDERGFKSVRQSRGEEFVARAWKFKDGRSPAADMDEGKPITINAGPVTLSVRVQRVKKGRDFEFFVISEGHENGKPVFTVRGEESYSPQPGLKAAFVKLEGGTPQAVVSQYTGGAHCCMRTTIMTKGAGAKWQTVKAGAIDGDYGPAFEDLDGDGTFEMLSGDNRFLYEFDSYAASRMPARIEKLVGGKLVDVTRDPKYRRYHVQYLAGMEAGADAETWKESGFLAGWVAQKALLGERAEAIEKARTSFRKGDTLEFEVCMVNRPADKCPEIQKKLISFADALGQFLDKNGYR
jgi:serine protease Do